MKFIDFFAGIGGFRRGMELHLNALTDRRAAKDIGRYSYQEKTERNIKGGIQEWRMVRK